MRVHSEEPPARSPTPPAHHHAAWTFLHPPPWEAQLQDTLSHHQPFAGFILERFINFSDCSKPRGAFCGWGEGWEGEKGAAQGALS